MSAIIPSQRRLALDAANVIKSQRPALRRAVKGGELSLAAALVHPVLASMELWDLLCLLPGPRHTYRGGTHLTRSERVAERLLGVLDRRASLIRVRELTARERDVLIAEWDGGGR